MAKLKKPIRSKIAPIITNKFKGGKSQRWMRKMPDEVMRIWAENMQSSVTGFTWMKRIERRRAAVIKYPHWFKWETAYDKIPAAVHEAFKMEAYGPPKDFTSLWEENLDVNTPSAGLIEQLNKPTVHYYDPSKFKIQDLFDSLDRHYKAEQERKVAEQLERKRLKNIWDKHYSVYNLEYRD